MVRRIFQLTIEGKGPYDIARILHDEKVEAPAVYQARQGRGTWKSKEDFPHPYNWSGFVVGQTLSKPEYMGHTVNFRSHKESYKDKQPIYHTPEDWLIFENTHEAIVDKETWELAQKLRQTPRRHEPFEEANPFTGLLYCADCGEKLYNHRNRGNSSKPYPTDGFNCSSYTLSRQKHYKACSNHHISTRALRTLVLETIRATAAYAISNEAEFIQKVREASAVQQEQETLKASIAEAEEALANFEKDTARVDCFLELAKKYTDFSELTTTMINEFIDRIIVHAPDRSEGDRTQEVEIYLKYIGRFEAPVPEPTPEEVRRQEQLHRYRVKSRER